MVSYYANVMRSWRQRARASSQIYHIPQKGRITVKNMLKEVELLIRVTINVEDRATSNGHWISCSSFSCGPSTGIVKDPSPFCLYTINVDHIAHM